MKDQMKPSLSLAYAMKKKSKKMAQGGEASARMEDDRNLNQHGDDETGPMGGGEGFHDESYMGNPGDYQDKEHEADMVGRIIAQRAKAYSQGGKVANDTKITAGFKDNLFDDLALRDDLESSYTGANSGDMDGSPEEDIVSKVMASRKKKLPNPR